jgi:hypothetical protein
VQGKRQKNGANDAGNSQLAEKASFYIHIITSMFALDAPGNPVSCILGLTLKVLAQLNDLSVLRPPLFTSRAPRLVSRLS